MNELHNRILEKAKTGFRLRDIPGSPYQVKRATQALLAAGRLVRRCLPGRDISIYFDSVETARAYMDQMQGLSPLVALRSVEAMGDVQVLPGVRYQNLDTKNLPNGFYTRL
jgi:ribosomal protein S12